MLHTISDGVYCVHADIQTKDLFEGIWPVARGVSLNCYLVRGEKTALIDLVRDWTDAPGQLEAKLSELGLSFADIDYLILNHLEPDHTGWLREFFRVNTRAEILATPKGIKLVRSFYGITERLKELRDGDSLDLGKGRILRFIETPNIHWPETMVTYDEASGTLFSCDAFGAFGALGDKVFDDQLSAEEHAFFEEETLRYYSNIIASFSSFVEKGIQKIRETVPVINCVAPSHGPVWRKDPNAIIKRYLDYAAYARGKTEKEICVIWGSMYGNTKAGVDAVIRGIEAEGVPYTAYRVPDEDVSYVLAGAYKSAGLVIAMPTYEYAVFPPMAYVLDIFRRKHISGKTVLRIGSWGWAGGAKKEYEGTLEKLSWTSMEALEWPGFPDGETLALLEARGRELARRVQSL
ncbi:MAG: FprA family A-type flavoprotein [Spirochaetaceae bacterium]|jgi:flavorubredoxin|nr:FprA family A-type flavoprotein [Spirochaetaceae bacterium]